MPSIGRKILLLVLAILLVSVPIAYRYLNPPRAKNLIIISIDALRPDHLQVYGYGLDQPNLSGFAAKGVVFDRAYTTMPTTAPAMSSVMTSLYPRSHTVRKNGILLPETALTLAEILKTNGWKTAAFVSAFPLDKRFQLNQGFDEYRDSIGAKGKQKNLKFEVSGDLITRAVSRWLDKNNPQEKTFLWIHYFDPHAPYSPPAKFRTVQSPRKDSNPEMNGYDGEIAFLDEQLGILFRKLDQKQLLENSLILIVSDHGEGFGEHGYQGHGWFLYEEVMRTALIVRAPGIKAGRSDDLVHHIDLAPGILDYFKIQLPATFEGKSWFSILRKRIGPLENIWMERRLPPLSDGQENADEQGHAGIEEKWAVRSQTEKFIWSSDGKHEFYNLADDPFEKNNLFTPQNNSAARLMKFGLETRLKAEKIALKQGRDIQQQDEETKEALKALGYVN